MDEREQIIKALYAFIAQRGGIEPGNYGDYASYRQEQRSVTRDRHHAEKLLGAISWRTGITADHLKAAMKRAFSGRLSWHPESHQELPDGTKLSGKLAGSLDYTTGQYFPTEYRKAVASVCAAALWEYWREDYAPPNPEGGIGRLIRKSARKEFGLEIAKRYFDYRAEDYR